MRFVSLIRVSLIRAAPAGVLAALVAGGLGGCISTTTYGTGEAPETTLLREATGGMLNKLNGEDEQQIDYEPRAPLVIPPTAQLPQPAPEASELAGGQWPEEVEETEERRLAGANPETRAMSPDYVRRMRPLGRFNRNRQRERLYERDPAKAFLAEQYSRKEFEARLAEADGLNRTQRRFLTDPPSQYREPAETAPAQFEDIEKKKDGNFFSRLFGGG